MPKLSVSQAAKAFNVSRPTLQKALRDGTISGERIRKGSQDIWQIDQSELSRLYQPRGDFPAIDTVKDLAPGQGLAVPKSSNIEELSAKHAKELEAIRAELDQVRAQKDEVERDRVQAERELAAAQAVAEERKRMLDDVMKLLPKPEETATSPSWWAKWFGGRRAS